MTKSAKLEAAQDTCDGLQKLLHRLNIAAIDVDKGGASCHELSALLAAATDCAHNLGGLLEEIDSPARRQAKTADTVVPIHATAVASR